MRSEITRRNHEVQEDGRGQSRMVRPALLPRMSKDTFAGVMFKCCMRVFDNDVASRLVSHG